MNICVESTRITWCPNNITGRFVFRQFSPDGVASIIYDFHRTPPFGDFPEHPPLVCNGLVADNLYNGINVWTSAQDMASTISRDIFAKHSGTGPDFYIIRITWISAGQAQQFVDALKRLHPNLDFEVLDPYNYFALHKRVLQYQ